MEWKLEMLGRGVKFGLSFVAVAFVLGVGFIVREVGSKSTRITTRWVCPCVYVEGRDLDYCMSMTPVPVGRLVSVKTDDQAQAIEASSFLFFKSKARRIPNQSCVMEY